VQVDPIKPMFKALGTKRLRLNYADLLSSFAFKFKLRRYGMGTLSIAEVKKMADEGVDIENAITPEKRMAMFRKNAEARLTDGSGSADLSALTEGLPADLLIDPVKVGRCRLTVSRPGLKARLVSALET